MKRTISLFNANAQVPNKPQLGLRQARGFSLIELMVALSVLGIVTAIAVPSFNEAKLSMSLRSNANNLVASIQLARSEAIKSNSTVRLCASDNGTSCQGAWQDGWIVLNAANSVIQHQQAITPGYMLIEANALTTLNFSPTGIGATQASLTVCRQTPTVGSQERVIAVSVTGKPSVRKTTQGTCGS